MSKLKKNDQQIMLDQLANLGFGQSESENESTIKQNLHPIPQHLRAFDPDVVLIVGDRGTGKSALFNAVFKNKLLPQLGPFVPELRLPYQDTQHVVWTMGYPIGSDFPDPRGLKNLNSNEKFHDIWFAYLTRILSDKLQDHSLDELYEVPGGDPDSVLEIFNKLGNKPLLALDRLDKALEKENSWIFIGYDELDTLGGFDWEVMTKAVQGLIAFWSSYTRRWRRIRAKIFLRSDLFRRHSGLGGADLAKLSANRVELTWNNKNLFAMLIKRIANKSDQLYEYCKKAKIVFKEDSTFGHIPDLKEAGDARLFIERLIGKYMGASNRKGLSFNWVLDHLRDGKKMVTPRLLVRLFELAAEKEGNNPRASDPNLLHPTSLRQALDDVSVRHVTQAIDSEWPWLDGIRTRIRENEKNKLVPWKRIELQEVFEEKWEKSWSQSKPNVRPPALGAREFIDYLIELGIFRERTGQRIDVPDIYLSGLGLKRKGGVKRK
ncbi:MAG: P-loop ATPase, Sll1717 family [Candidatus Omnitrophota bacterium]